MKIEYIGDGSAKGTTRIFVSDGENKYRLTVSNLELKELGDLFVGDFIDEDTYRRLEAMDKLRLARNRALRILSFGDNSERALARKLRGAGFSREVGEQVVKEMVMRGYLDVDRQLARLIVAEVSVRLTGRRKLIPKLCAKGYDSRDVIRVLDALSASGEIDLDAARAQLLEKHGVAPDTDEGKKLLYKNGFDVY